MTYDFRRRNLLLPVSLKILVLVQQSYELISQFTLGQETEDNCKSCSRYARLGFLCQNMFRASHLIGTGDYYFTSRNLRAQSYQVKLIYWILLYENVQGDRVKSNTCSYQRQSDKTSQILKMRPKSGSGGAGQQQQTRGDKNLNLINNNRSRWGSIYAWYIIQKIINMKSKCENLNDQTWW